VFVSLFVSCFSATATGHATAPLHSRLTCSLRKQYFDTIFGKVTSSDIEAFASKYKCSDEEKRDVLKEFKKQKGDLVKMLDFVMLSEARDAIRWVEDFIVPAVEAGELEEGYRAKMDKTLKECQKRADKENQQSDDSETESEEEMKPVARRQKSEEKKPAARRQKTKTPPKKGKPTVSKKRSKTNTDTAGNMDDLVAAIQNKNRGGASSSVFTSLGARYGVSMTEDEDPLNDAEFAKIQAKLKKK
jgi:hypothetical protein